MVALDAFVVYIILRISWDIQKIPLIQPSFYPRISEYSVLLIPLLTEFFLRKFSVIEVHGAVDFLQISAYCLTILVRYELAAVANLVDYAS